MSEFALSCIVCNKQLENVFQDAENQPYDGLSFTSSGAYGSTVFDPMDGTIIEINICDDCLKNAGEKQKVYCTRVSRPIMFPMRVQWHPSMGMEDQIIDSIIGWERIERPFVYWKADLAEYDHDERVVFDTKQELREYMNTHDVSLNIEIDSLEDLK